MNNRLFRTVSDILYSVTFGLLPMGSIADAFDGGERYLVLKLHISLEVWSALTLTMFGADDAFGAKSCESLRQLRQLTVSPVIECKTPLTTTQAGVSSITPRLRQLRQLRHDWCTSPKNVPLLTPPHGRRALGKQNCKKFFDPLSHNSKRHVTTTCPNFQKQL